MSGLVLIALFLALAAGLPLLGAWLAGRPVAPYLAFPPHTEPSAPGEFSWLAFTLMSLFVLAALAPFAWHAAHARAAPRGSGRPGRMPWWGWVGVALTGVAWVLAWNRFAWFAALQPFTFTPLWIGYILTISGLTCRRTGHCWLRDRPGCFLALFPASAVFWWYFEYLNRFVRNWYYLGASELGPIEYVVQASIPFATVLPAVLATAEWLASFPRLQAAFTGLRALPAPAGREAAVAALLLAGFGLLGIGLWPDFFYPMVWVAPALVLVSLRSLRGEPHLFSGLPHGDWRSVWLPALAALQCGLFWELWNWKSLVRWAYSVPLVQGLHVFEMPLLGYAGYLPFGLACAAVGALVCRPPREPLEFRAR